MDTPTSILLTQIPIAIAILIGAYEMHKFRKELMPLLRKIIKKKE